MFISINFRKCIATRSCPFYVIGGSIFSFNEISIFFVGVDVVQVYQRGTKCLVADNFVPWMTFCVVSVGRSDIARVATLDEIEGCHGQPDNLN